MTTTLDTIRTATAGRGHATDIPRIPELAPALLAENAVAAGELLITHEAIMKHFIEALNAAEMESDSVLTEEGRATALWFLIDRRIRPGIHQRGNKVLPDGLRFSLAANAKTRNGRDAIKISVVSVDAD